MNKLLLVVIAIALLGAGFLAANFLQAEQQKTMAAEKVAKPDVQYLAMERFIISVANEEYARYLVLDLSLGFTPTLQNEMDAETFMPVLRNILVKQFANMSHDKVKATFSDVDQVQSTLLQQFNLVLADKASLKIADVLVTNVFIQ